ncbi:hypothetical protein SAMN04487968_101237 [Nocardioides terrae]|uniref:Uncharacterized protein n=1 Tax=Nocardioides terrae TaxID=574651 RepID=A0A1I1DFY6_9ACTN|nr:UPF0182 family protein [Nocardioides terrae]SFB73899.1 hypothetical protein SAMN04487968_101237 [Nocardioides terrae]
MSELFDDDPRDSPPRSGSGRTRALVITAVALAVALFLLTTFASLWTDHLWFDRMGYGSVFTRLFRVRAGLFLVFGLIMGGAVAATIMAAYRSRPLIQPAAGDNGLERYRDAVNPIRTWLLVGVAVIAGVFAGASGAGKWRTYLLWRNGGDFGQDDPYFGKDIGFYVFDLPWWHLLVNFVMAASVVALLLSLLVHYLYGGIRLQSQRDRVSPGAQVQLSTLIAIFVLAKAADYWLDRYDLVHGDGPKMTGISFTDDRAVLPAKAILAGIAVICAVLFLVNIWRRTWLLPGVGAALLLISAILLGLIWPAIVQGFQVRPSPDKEIPYLAKNIDATRQAYAIDDSKVMVQNYTAQANASGPASLAQDLDAQVASAPLVDPLLVHDLFEESQQERSYYSLAEPLDVDRYDIGGKDRALVLGVRELDQSGIDPKDRNWTNLHTTYTHGSGVIAAYANQRPLDDSGESESIQWAQGNQGAQNDLVENGPGQFEQRVYFGEQATTYAVVGRPDGASPVELDLAESGEDAETHTTYDGRGGVPIGSTFRRLMYGIKFGSSSFLLSGRMNENSEVLYNRTPRQRVEKVAPWLTLDDDAYPVVVDGRIQWVLDGYTTTDHYPGSEKDSFQEMTDDVLQQNTGLRTLPTDQINYMRNAVKATVDAYDGTVRLYAWDESDPILHAWSKAFPGTVLPRSAIPDDLLPHLRYPEDLFKVQRFQLAKYHVTDARAFLQGSDWWQVPTDPATPGEHLMAPYRMFLDETGSDKEVWSLSTTFTPNGRNNLSAVMTVNSDATSPEYGTMEVLERPDQQTQGPGQVFSNLKNDSAISSALLPYQGTGSLVTYGNLLTIPTTSHGLMYVMPVYAKQGTSSPYPVLAYVLVSYDNHLGYGKTLQAAITSALKSTGTPQTPTPTSPPSPNPSGSPTPTPSGNPNGNAEQRARALLDEAQTLFTQADAAGKAGDFAKREELLEQAQDKVAQAVALLE